MTKRILAAIALSAPSYALALVACSGSASTGFFTGGDAAAGTDGSPAPSDGGGDRGDAQGLDNRIDPLEIGRTWTFNVTPTDGGIANGGCAAGTQTSTVIGPGIAQDGLATVRYQPLCDNFLVDALVQGDKVIAFPVDGGAATGVVLDAPVEEGHTWNYGGTGLQFVWHSVGTLSVPAGQFSDCWARAYVTGSQSRFIYCRGVGLTELDDAEFRYRAVLTSKNF